MSNESETKQIPKRKSPFATLFWRIWRTLCDWANKLELTGAVIPAVLVTLLVLLLEYNGWLASPIGKLSDAIWGTTTPVSGAELSPLLIVEINDDAFQKCFKRTQPLKPSLIGAMVKGLSGLHPRVVGIDILSEDWTSAERSVVQGLTNVVWMAGGEVSHHPPSFVGWLTGNEAGFVVTPGRVLGLPLPQAGISWAMPFFPLSDDGKVRLVHQMINVQFRQESPERKLTLAAALSPKSVKDEPYYIAYGPPEPERFAMADLFDCRTGELLASYSDKRAQFLSQIGPKTIILLGGTFRESGDAERETPIGPMPGLIVNAYAIQTLMGGHPRKEESHGLAALIDLAAGLLFAGVYAASRRRKWNATKWAVPASLLASIAGSASFGREYVPGVVAIFLGILLHHICEGWLSEHRRHRKPRAAAGA